MDRRAIPTLVALVLLLAAACSNIPGATSSLGPQDRPLRVLFVGNSLTYYNDLPSKFAAIQRLREPGREVRTEMLAEGGASLRERIADGSLARALDEGHYDVVVLQDFGAWPLCSQTLPACEAGTASLETGIRLARRHGAIPVWFGTWMTKPGMQPALSNAGADTASRLHVAFADVGKAIHAVSRRIPGALQQDGHPAPLGSWIAAASLSMALQPDTALPDTAPKACGTRWQDRDLHGNRLASMQQGGPPVCDAPTPAQWSAIRAVLPVSGT